MDRLSRTQWLEHGLETLATSGFTALKADKLAKSLGVSRGSFYWHFANLADFHKGILERWQQTTVDEAIEVVESQSEFSTAQLHLLIQMAASGNVQIERAVRAWADSNDEVRAVVEQVDQRRITFLEQVFINMGLPVSMAEARALIVYYAFLGQMVVYQPISAETQMQVAQELFRLTAIATGQ